MFVNLKFYSINKNCKKQATVFAIFEILCVYVCVFDMNEGNCEGMAFCLQLTNILNCSEVIIRI